MRKHHPSLLSSGILCLAALALSSCGLQVRALRFASKTAVQLTGPCHTGEGDGSPEEPFPLFDADDWAELDAQPTAGTHFILCSDLDFSGIAYAPITSFEGVLNGNSRTISNVEFDNQDASVGAQKQGLFRTLNGAMIRDLTLEGFNLHSESRHLGALAGETTNGTLVQRVAIRNATLTGTQQIGAFIGYQINSRIENSAATGIDIDVSHPTYSYSGLLAGIIQRNDGEDTLDCENVLVSGTIRTHAGGRYFGGLAGMANGTSIRNVTVRIDVPATQSGGWIGGMFGQIDTATGTSNRHENIVLSGTFSVGSGGGRVGAYVGQFQGPNTLELRNIVIDLPIVHANSSKGTIAGFLMTSSISLDNVFWTSASLAQAAPGAITNDGISGQLLDADFRSGGFIHSDPATNPEWKNTSIWRFSPSALPGLAVEALLQ